MNEDFLLKEYEECFTQIRFYDDRSASILKLALGVTASVGSALLALAELLKPDSQRYFVMQTFLCVCVFVGLTILFLVIVQNRLYFITAARQLNALRILGLEKNPDFVQNRMWDDPNWPAFNPFSTHTFIMLLFLLLSSLFLGGALMSYSLARSTPPEIGTTVLKCVLVSVSEFALAVGYLAWKGRVRISKRETEILAAKERGEQATPAQQEAAGDA